MEVCGCLNWTVEAWVGSLLMKVISGQNRDRCLWCWVQAVVSVKAEAWVVWEGDVSVSSWEEFGRDSGSVELGISEGRWLGSDGGRWRYLR